MPPRLLSTPIQRVCFAAVALVAVGFLIYSNSFQAGIHFDTWTLFQEFDRLPFDTFEQWSSLCREDRISRCVTYLSFALNYYFSDSGLFGFHLCNLLIHIGASLLVYGFMRLVLLSALLKNELLKTNADVISLLAALVFLTHPLQTQAVTYLWQRFASLATFFYLASVVSYMAARLRSNRIFYGISLITAALGLFTKEIIATLPIMIVLCEFAFFEPPKSAGKRWLLLSPFLSLIIVLPVTVLLSGKLNFYLTPQSYLGKPAAFGATYFFTQLNVLCTYLRLFFIPVGQNVDYDYAYSYSLFEARTFLSFLFLAALLLWGFLRFRRTRLVGFGILWYFLTMSVESSFLPIRDVIFEHRMYLPMVGLSMAVSSGAFLFLKDRRKFIAVGLVVVAVFSMLTYRRNIVWRDDVSLWSDVVEKSPNKGRGHGALCNALAARKDYDGALPYCLNAVRLNPKDFLGYNTLGFIYTGQGKYAQAKEALQEAIKIHLEIGLRRAYTTSEYDFLSIAYNSLGNVVMDEGNVEAAAGYYLKSSNLNPELSEAGFNLGRAFERMGKPREAAEAYEWVIVKNQKYFLAYLNLAGLYGQHGDYPQVIKLLQRVVELDPKNIQAHQNLAVSYGALGDRKRMFAEMDRLKELGRGDLAEELLAMAQKVPG
ncbi:MAG: tetratricopeptide repeat protein [Candidatus Omnitrophota bacterium]|nr:tetratricopeptide repeat protein [Candidatus Omnitrophota bacterium]